MWFNFVGTPHPSRDLKRWRSRSKRLRVVTRIHVEGLGLHNMMDRNSGIHSDDEGVLDSIVAHGAGKRTLSQALTSADLSFRSSKIHVRDLR